ncbi:MAG TPA: hypothetical protein VIV60_26565 [Polyangiaceae bacterium]
MTRVWLRGILRHCACWLVLLLFTAAGRVGWVAWQRRSPTVHYTPVVLDDRPAKHQDQALPLDLEHLRGQLLPRIPSELMTADSTVAGAGRDNRPKQSRV